VSRVGWFWIWAGSLGALVLMRRRPPHRAAATLGLPIEGRSLTATPHGFFGAARSGPPIHSHQGVDLAARPGSRIFAVGDGAIVATDPGLGKIVRKLRLDRPESWGGETVDAIVYADLGLPLVEPGKRVRQGDVIAYVAPAGFVHFAVKQRTDRTETFIDPKRAGFDYRLAGQEAHSWLS
jgi:murein DD-endopeptidase MepM/ murein hydrolase activator NlpD